MALELEKPLYRELAAFRRGDPDAATRAHKLLINHTSHSLTQLMPALQAMLKLDNEELQVLAAGKLALLGKDASPALDDLKELALKQIVPKSVAAATALASIPGERTLEGLIEIGECWAKNPEMREEIIHHLLPFFIRHGEAMRPFLKRFQAAIGPCFSADNEDEARLARSEMKRAYHSLGLFKAWDHEEVKLPASPALELRGELVDPTPEQLPAAEGLIAQRTIRAILDDHVMSVILEIYHPCTGPLLTRPVVVLVFEGRPFEWTFEQTFAMLASLIKEKFDLPADETVWLDHNPPHSERNSFSCPETYRVDMVFFDDCNRYGLPQVNPVRSIEAVISDAQG